MQSCVEVCDFRVVIQECSTISRTRNYALKCARLISIRVSCMHKITTVVTQDLYAVTRRSSRLDNKRRRTMKLAT
jgi:hypothetical protein